MSVGYVVEVWRYLGSNDLCIDKSSVFGFIVCLDWWYDGCGVIVQIFCFVVYEIDQGL